MKQRTHRVCVLAVLLSMGWASAATLSRDDQALLDDLSHRSFQFFWEQSDPNTGVARDRTRVDGKPNDYPRRDVGSTGATGFGLTALCIGVERGWITRAQARERVLHTLEFYADRAKEERRATVGSADDAAPSAVIGAFKSVAAEPSDNKPSEPGE